MTPSQYSMIALHCRTLGWAGPFRAGRCRLNRATSLYLDLVRPAAAFTVLLSHVAYRTLPGEQPGVVTSSGVQAVDIFLVLSGFVIAHVCATRESDIRSYFVRRAARIYSVVIPALILTATADFIGVRTNVSLYQEGFQAFSPGLLIRCVFFLGEQWNAHRFPGSNSPYWSLGFEVWYYIAFGGFVFSPHRWRWIVVSIVLVFIGPKVTLMFPVWLMGVATYHVCTTRRFPLAAGWTLFIGSIAIMILYEALPHSPLPQFANATLEMPRLWSTGQDYFVGVLFSVHLIGFASVSTTFAGWLDRNSRWIRWISGATFSIYLAHLPVVYLLMAISPWPRSSSLTVALLLTVTPTACLLFAEVSERRKDIWRRVVDRGVRFALKRAFLVDQKSA
jgi:peptidoglycan/LPS O-acetylase OafA/YrhL